MKTRIYAAPAVKGLRVIWAATNLSLCWPDSCCRAGERGLALVCMVKYTPEQRQQAEEQGSVVLQVHFGAQGRISNTVTLRGPQIIHLLKTLHILPLQLYVLD